MTPAAPSITDVSPESGRPGDPVLIRGTHFEGPLRVEIGGVAAAVVGTGEGQVTVTVPDQARTGRVIVYAKGGRVASRADFQVNLKPFDPRVDVVPFSFAQVEHWPGLGNTGTSCFINSAIKLLAAIREVDPALADHTGDDAALAEVRRQLRFTLNFIRLGDKRPADAQDPMRGLIDSFQHHPTLAPFAAAAGNGGTDTSEFLGALLQALGVDTSFRIGVRVKFTKTGGTPTYSDDAFTLRVTESKTDDGKQYQGPKTLESYVHYVTRNASASDSKFTYFDYPVKVPALSIINVRHDETALGLAFSPLVRIPVYQVDETHHSARILQEATLHPIAASITKGGHAYSVILGPGGFWINDDAKKPYMDPQFAIDGDLAKTRNLVTGMTIMVFRRDS